MRRYEISDQQWLKIASLLPGKVGDVGRSAIDNRPPRRPGLYQCRALDSPQWSALARLARTLRTLELSLSPISAVGKGKPLATRF